MATPSQELHDLLAQVASGELDPAEAARRLDEDPTAPTVDTAPLPSYTGITGVVITGVGVRLHVVADPSVATAVADGPHLVRQDDDRLVFDLPGRARREDGFAATPRWQWGKMRIDWPYGSGERVTVRVNPALSLRLELTACDANVRGMRSALEVGCFSSSLGVVDHDGPLTGTITTGSARIDAVLRGKRRAVVRHELAQAHPAAGQRHDDGGPGRDGLDQGGRADHGPAAGRLARPAYEHPGGGRCRHGPPRGRGADGLGQGGAAVSTTHRPPRACPVCSHDLVVTGLGCPDCGTGISGAFATSPYDALSADELEMLRVFLVSRGNMRELEKHLGVSYPTTRQRFADLLVTLGLEDPAGAARKADRDKVLVDLAAGRLSVDEAETLLTS